MINNTDTICAPATATGGALAVVRVSGPQAFTIVSAICSVCCDSVAANTVHFTRIHDAEGGIVDEVLLSVFRAPHSYTGENSVEISCHGSSYIINKVLELLMQHGCRMAGAGEFTQRAFLNGKLDLSQAEAVADLISASNQATHDMAMSQLRGHFSSRLAQLREQLLHLTTLLELELDFADHEDLEFADRTEILALARQIDQHITRLAQSFEAGNAMKQGIPVAIVGKTNVGKSTLLNRLLHDERAIVSDVHGTTRDTIEDCIDIHGVQFRIIDTAGLRTTSDKIENIGIERTYQAIQKARIVLWVIDQLPSKQEVDEMQEKCQGKSLITVKNKADLDVKSPSTSCLDSTIAESHPHAPTPDTQYLSISAKQGTNLAALEKAIFDSAHLPEMGEQDVIVSNARHYEALTQAHEHLIRVTESLQANVSGDLVAEDLRLALSVLAEITGGQITPQETLNNIFSHFCVGK